MSKITYSVEILYHLNCHHCGRGYWSISQQLPPIVACTYCGFAAEPISNEMATEVLRKVYQETKSNFNLLYPLGILLRRGRGIDHLTYEEFLIELAKPEPIFLETNGIGPNGIEALRRHVLDPVHSRP